MICPYCGSDNKDSAKFCKSCGKSLNPISTMKKEHLDSYNKSNTANTPEIQKNSSSIFNGKNLIIICLTLIVCIGLIMGSVLYIYSNNTATQDNDNFNQRNDENLTDNMINQTNDGDEDSQDTTDTSTTETETSSNYDNIKIIGGKFYTGNKLSDKTYCDVYVGSENAGTPVKIKILYSRNGKTLNPGNVVPKTVNSDGYVSLRSANAFKYYPDHAFITLYDLEDNILDTMEVTMSASKGTQTF